MASGDKEKRRLVRQARTQTQRAKHGGRYAPTVEILHKARTPKAKGRRRKGGD